MGDIPLEGGPVPTGPKPAPARRLARNLQRALRSAATSIRATVWAARFSILFLSIGVGIAIGLVVLMGFLNFYDLPYIVRELPKGFGPAKTSLEFATFTYLIGMTGALGLGLIRAYPPKKTLRLHQKVWRWPLYAFASGYVAAIRGTPFLVQLQIVYLALIYEYPRFTYFGWDAIYWAGFFALLINTTGYQAEAIRGGLQAVEPGQIEGAKAMGLGKFQTFIRITMPQTLRLITLPLTNEWISNFKTATILSVIGIFELFDWTRTDIALLDARPIEAFVILIIFYLVINVTLSRVITYVEKVRRIPGLGTPIPEVSMTKRFLTAGAKTRNRDLQTVQRGPERVVGTARVVPPERSFDTD